MSATLLREKISETEAFYFAGVEEDGAEVEEWLGDHFVSLIPSKDQVEFRYGPLNRYKSTAKAGEVILKEDVWVCAYERDDIAEDYEAVWL